MPIWRLRLRTSNLQRRKLTPDRGFNHATPDESVPRYKSRKFIFAEHFGPDRPDRHNEIAQIGVTVVNTNLDIIGQLDTELAKHLARLSNRT
jgi:hypothetical protein